MYTDADVAALYNVLNPWGTSDEFYLDLVMTAPTVLDVGCGTGNLLHRARDRGHGGRLVGIDPDPAALDVARQRGEIEWIESTAAAMDFDGEFALAVMMSHAFQSFATDDDLRASLTAIHRSLTPGGCFVFETRNPEVREWEIWTPEHPIDVVDPEGRAVRITYHVLSVERDVVTLTETTSDPDGTVLRVDRGMLRFIDLDTLNRALTGAGFAIDVQHGGWLGEALRPDSAEIVTFARRQ